MKFILVPRLPRGNEESKRRDHPGDSLFLKNPVLASRKIAGIIE
jgi:hypothetical protein